MNGLKAIYKRELTGYFATPVAYVFIAIFLLSCGAFTFFIGGLYESGNASLAPFFQWHPWLYLFLVPAVSMRLWAEERRSGTMEVLFTMPVPLWQLVLGKFFAAWMFTAIALCFTFPIWTTISYLGNPDHGIIIASYLGSLLMAGGYLAIGSCMSALTRNQVIAFVISVFVCFLFTVAGFPMVLSFFEGWLPQFMIDLISSFSFMSNFTAIQNGVLEMSAVVYFVSLIMFWLFTTTIILETKRG
jgi:ABC-2 type transport system permease protein